MECLPIFEKSLVCHRIGKVSSRNDCNERETVEYKKQFLAIFSYVWHQSTVQSNKMYNLQQTDSVRTTEDCRAASNHLYMLTEYIWTPGGAYNQSPHELKIKEISSLNH